MIVLALLLLFLVFFSLIALGYKRAAMVLAALLLVALGYNKPAQMLLDAKIDRQCAVDGGVKVYETVQLPPGKFDKYGNVILLNHLKEDTLGPEYIYKYQTTWLNSGGEQADPRAYRTHEQVLRRSDGKLLGESVNYGRVGSAPRWLLILLNAHGTSSHRCPKESKYVTQHVFIKNTGGVQ